MRAHARRYPSEADFQTAVVDVARLSGWRIAHFRSLRRADGSWRVPTTYDAHGWPDLTLVRPPRLIFAELKSHTGKPSERQLEWLAVLRLVPGVEVYLWGPDDWHSLVEVLTGREAGMTGGEHRSPRHRPSTGVICPACAGPKTLQAVICRLCWRDTLFVEHATRCSCPDCRARESLKRHERRVRAGEIRGTSTGRPQPQSHPWRKSLTRQNITPAVAA